MQTCLCLCCDEEEDSYTFFFEIQIFVLLGHNVEEDFLILFFEIQIFVLLGHNVDEDFLILIFEIQIFVLLGLNVEEDFLILYFEIQVFFLCGFVNTVMFRRILTWGPKEKVNKQKNPSWQPSSTDLQCLHSNFEEYYLALSFEASCYFVLWNRLTFAFKFSLFTP